MANCKIFYAARLQEGGKPVFIGQHPTDSERLEWPNGSYCTKAAKFEIIKEYELPKNKNYWRTVDKLNVEFLQEFYPPKKMIELKQSAGILAPNGDFYPCHYGGHEPLAERISAIFFNELGNSTFLEEKGYIRLMDNGCTYENFKPNQAQLNMLFDLSNLGDEEWKRHINYLINGD